MQANPRCIDDLFNSQLRYVVPMFQRLYVWGETPQWATLWEDIVEKADLQLAGERSTPHYLGALIIEGVRPTSPREVKRFLVIDGQQRLTTIQLLLCAFRDVARDHEWKTLDRTTTRLLENVDPDVMEHPEEELYKLWPTTMNREIFRNIVSAGSFEAVEAAYPVVRLRRRRRNEPRSRLVEAYTYFNGVIKKWINEAAPKTGGSPESSAFALLQAIQRDFAVVEIALTEGDDSQEIFYSLNSQGAVLSQSDLLRSLIFMRAEKEKLDKDLIFEEYWSRFESHFWSTDTKRGGRTYSRLDLALRYFLMAKTGQMVDARRVNEEYRRWVTAVPPRFPSVRDELKDFTSYAEGYKRYEELPDARLPSTDFRRIIRDFDVSTVLPLVLYLERDAHLDTLEVDACLKVLEGFIVRRAITGEETKEYNKFFVEVIGVLREVKPNKRSSELVRKLTAGVGSTRNWPSDAEIMDAAIRREIGHQLRAPALRILMERLELSSRSKKSEDTDIASSLQIEHVMPQAWGPHWPIGEKTIPAHIVTWTWNAVGEFAPFQEEIRQRNAAVQTLGNLTLLNQFTNPAASNNSFTEKLTEYRHSVLRLNRYFDVLDSWDETAIRARGKYLGEQLCAIWPRPDPDTTGS